MYSIVIPVFRAKESLEKICTSIDQNLEAYEVIFVFDCGLTDSLNTIKKLSDQFEKVHGIELSRNYGQHNAIICGIERAKGDWIVTMDEDLQHDPGDIIKLIQKQKETKADLVYGVYHELSHSKFRNLTSQILKKILSIGLPELHSDYTSFRLINAEMAKKTCEMTNSYTFLDGYLSWLTTNIASVVVSHGESQEGQSAYTIKKLIEHSINIFITFSNLPIRILTFSAFAFFLFSTLYAVFIIISSVTYRDYNAGFPTLIAFLGFGLGLVLFGLGTIGEYLSRVNHKTTKRPNYFIRRIY